MLWSAVQLREISTGGEYDGTFKERAAGKAQLKEFYKLVHPDMVARAPKEVKDMNSDST